MRSATLASLALLLALPAASIPVFAQEEPKAGKSEKQADDDLAPFPEPKTIRQSATIGGKSVSYDASVGALPVNDAKGKLIGEVVYTAYTVPGAAAENRPVTFAFNGGPGAASVFLNLGAIGPKRVQFGAQGDAPSDPAILRNNPNSWLDFTDLVFIDPVGTGFSRSRTDEATTKKEFYEADADIHYLSRIIYDWLLKNGRLSSPKYLTGESYGGYRLPRLAHYLQTQIGVGINGMTLVSPYLDPAAIGDDTALSPMPWMINYPAMAAGHFERQGRHLDDATMKPVEDYLRGQFVADFLAGPRNEAATARLSQNVAEITGLDPALVRRMDGRIDIGTYLREIRRDEGLVGSVYDSNYTAYDPFPASSRPLYNDPLLTTLIAPTTSAMVDFVTRQVGWKVEGRYNTLSYEVNAAWDRDETDSPVKDLRQAISIDPKMTVDIVHGWDDLSCPYFGSRLIIDQMPSFGQAERVKLHMYPGGHMFYSREDSAAAMRRDVMATYTGA